MNSVLELIIIRPTPQEIHLLWINTVQNYVFQDVFAVQQQLVDTSACMIEMPAVQVAVHRATG